MGTGGGLLHPHPLGLGDVGAQPWGCVPVGSWLRGHQRWARPFGNVPAVGMSLWGHAARLAVGAALRGQARGLAVGTCLWGHGGSGGSPLGTLQRGGSGDIPMGTLQRGGSEDIPVGTRPRVAVGAALWGHGGSGDIPLGTRWQWGDTSLWGHWPGWHWGYPSGARQAVTKEPAPPPRSGGAYCSPLRSAASP